MGPQVTKQNQGSAPTTHYPVELEAHKDPLQVLLSWKLIKVEMLFLCWTSQHEDQHDRKNCESEICRCEARAEVELVYFLHQTCSSTRTGAVHMGRSIPLAINQKSGIRPLQNLRFRTSLPASPDNENNMGL